MAQDSAVVGDLCLLMVCGKGHQGVLVLVSIYPRSSDCLRTVGRKHRSGQCKAWQMVRRRKAQETSGPRKLRDARCTGGRNMDHYSALHKGRCTSAL